MRAEIDEGVGSATQRADGLVAGQAEGRRGIEEYERRARYGAASAGNQRARKDIGIATIGVRARKRPRAASHLGQIAWPGDGSGEPGRRVVVAGEQGDSFLQDDVAAGRARERSDRNAASHTEARPRLHVYGRGSIQCARAADR